MYKCIKDFSIEECDDNGFPTGGFFIIKSGTKWERNRCMDIVGGDVHLECADGSQWIEISYDDLDKYFTKTDDENGDLISRKALLKSLEGKVYPEKFGERCNALDVINAVLQVIAEQTAIFDLENVIEKLQEKILNTTGTPIGVATQLAFEKCIKILNDAMDNTNGKIGG